MSNIAFLISYLHDLIEQLFVSEEGDDQKELIEHIRHIREMLNFEEEIFTKHKTNM